MDKFMEVDGGSTIATMCKLIETSFEYSLFCSILCSNLNGPYKKDNVTGRGIYWRGFTDAATYSRMMIRRK